MEGRRGLAMRIPSVRLSVKRVNCAELGLLFEPMAIVSHRGLTKGAHTLKAINKILSSTVLGSEFQTAGAE